jgi:hypothetical protein
VGAAELFLLGSNPKIMVLSGLEVAVEVSALGIGGEESGVLLGGHIEVLIDLSTLSKFQFQHLLFRSIADAGDTAGVYWNSLHAFLDADEPPPEGRENQVTPTSKTLAQQQDDRRRGLAFRHRREPLPA